MDLFTPKFSSSSFQRALAFDDVLLVPQLSDVESRRNIDISSSLGLLDFGESVQASLPDFDYPTSLDYEIPFISSPMDTITEERMAQTMAEAGGLGVIHRYNTIEGQVCIVNKTFVSLGSNSSSRLSCAIGVTGDFFERAVELFLNGVRIFCIDVAHGHHTLVRDALQMLRARFGDSIHIMAGNVATPDGFDDLANWGADSVRVGIGGGSICSTRIQTGHGIPTFQSILDITSRSVHHSSTASSRYIPIIADGGIRNGGDAAKALAAGADFLMLGSLLSGTPETPGEVHSLPVRDSLGNITLASKKCYRGMSSVEAQMDWRGHASSVEGVTSYVDLKPSAFTVIEDLSHALRSALSYSGVLDLYNFHKRSEFVLQTAAGVGESNTHIYNNS